MQCFSAAQCEAPFFVFRVRGGAPLYGVCETAEQHGKAARSLPFFRVLKVGLGEEEELEKGGGATEEAGRAGQDSFGGVPTFHLWFLPASRSA